MDTTNQSEKVTCRKCGHKWEEGQDGSHKCYESKMERQRELADQCIEKLCSCNSGKADFDRSNANAFLTEFVIRLGYRDVAIAYANVAGYMG